MSSSSIRIVARRQQMQPWQLPIIRASTALIGASPTATSAVPARSMTQYRSSTTGPAPLPPSPPQPPKGDNDPSSPILAAQRRNRPTAPYLSIYRPQITWLLSITHRLTGLILSGGFYAFGAAYLFAPTSLSSSALAASVAAWPVAVVVAAKMAIVWPFALHGINGLRHLMWDLGKGITNTEVKKSGWAVLGMSGVVTVGLAML